MKIKTSYLIYAVIGTIFAGLSMFTDIFERGNFEAIFSNLGMIIGLSISAYIPAVIFSTVLWASQLQLVMFF